MGKRQIFYAKYIKRFVDVVFSSVAIVLLSPIILLISILVKIKMGSPIIFKQKRPGKDERIFSMYKFRTMTDSKDENGNLLPDDYRLKPFGKRLRKTSLDELPELFNILKGDMSIVGPRPLLVEYLPYYYDEERIRHEVRPGLTGLAQINGRNASSWEERLYYDKKYVLEISFKNDIVIFFKTIKKTIKQEDVLVGSEIPAGRLDDYRRNK